MRGLRWMWLGWVVLLPTVLLVFLFSRHVNAANITHYVSAGGDCGSQPVCYRTIQEAVNAAAGGDTILIAHGVYTGSQTIMILAGMQNYTHTQVVFINKGLTLRGGYDQVDWSPGAGETVIDAGRHGRPVTVFYTSHLAKSLVVLDHLTLTGGDYTGLGNQPGQPPVCLAEDCGGGLYVYLSRIEVHNCLVYDNIGSRTAGYGGGIYIVTSGGSPDIIIRNTSVISNAVYGSDARGGGIYTYQPFSSMVFEDSLFQSNRAGAGGGMYLYDVKAKAVLERVDIIDNSAAEYGGGAIFRLTQTGDLLSLDQVRFIGNISAEGPAALYLAAAGGYYPNASFQNVLLMDNATTGRNHTDALIHVDWLFLSPLTLDMAHVTAAGNDTPTFFYADNYSSAYFTATITNTLLSGFDYGFVVREQGAGNIKVAYDHLLANDVITMTTIIEGTPEFIETNPVVGDPMLDAEGRLRPGSAAVDAGVDIGVSHDVFGKPRPVGLAPDIGAVELGQLYLPLILR